MATERSSTSRSIVVVLVIAFGLLIAITSRSDSHPHEWLSNRSLLSPSLEYADEAFHDLATRSSNDTIQRRDAYSCGPGQPCSNGACCGGSGYCGYGPTYCGSGCVSNCDAVAECGQYASPSGLQCPLNTCCSQYGFCGTTADFCGTGCQSNCVLSPSPPAGGSSTPVLDNKVIGYYESWSHTLSCHKLSPTDLPLDALTHINFAFAYISPGTYQIVSMDASTDTNLFSDITSVKAIKPDIKVFVSVGGWSFSDNGTATQPLYGEIAATAANRQTFANNVVQFMRQYGFDGLDIDWEYPGAPDRGGHKDDTANFVLLMETLRHTFDASGAHYDLTFTTPSSYWYLRWFDLPNMMKYADWTNFMTYDLHGVWDKYDPIGAIVQGHTNLTEIKLAADLFWRVNIPPSKIVMGIGFYGRSFTLESTSCTGVGCAFSGASNPGPCTATGGILGYYEILSILQQNPSISPIHDSNAAVMYFTYNNDQWVSFDNQETFKQKTDWANSVGLGGAMIWASDLDDDKYTAHSALLGRSVKSTADLSQQSLSELSISNTRSAISAAAAFNGQKCFAYTGGCVDLNDNDAMQAACGSTYTVVGWDDAGCGKSNCHCGKPICCPSISAPKDCKWRGNDNGRGAARSDCDAQCWVGEVNIAGIGSSWGGGFTNDGNTDKCARGYKAFCCPDPGFQDLVQGCYWSSCGGSCNSGEDDVLLGGGDCWIGRRHYCCPSPSPLTDCHYVTKTGGGVDSDCANAICSATEIEVERSQNGAGDNVRCAWGRNQVACCTVKVPQTKPATCSADLCKVPGLCTDDGTGGIALNKRYGEIYGNSSTLHELEKRGQDHYIAHLPNGIDFVVIAAIVNAISQLYAGPNSQQIVRTRFELRPGACLGPAVDSFPVASGSNPPGLQNDQTEHPLEPQFAARFLETVTRGRLRGPDGPLPFPRTAAIDPELIDRFWNYPFDGFRDAPAIGGPNGARPITANDRFMGAFGSVDWPEPLIPTDRQINGPKGQLWSLANPVSFKEITDQAAYAAQTDNVGEADFLLQQVRIGFAIFEYMNTPEFIRRFNLARNQVRQQLMIIENVFYNNRIPIGQLAQWWDIALDDFMSQLETRVQSFIEDATVLAARPYTTVNGRRLRTHDMVIDTLEQFLDRARDRDGTTLDAQFFVLPRPP